jgi:hypothetical protein
MTTKSEPTIVTQPAVVSNPTESLDHSNPIFQALESMQHPQPYLKTKVILDTSKAAGTPEEIFNAVVVDLLEAAQELQEQHPGLVLGYPQVTSSTESFEPGQIQFEVTLSVPVTGFNPLTGTNETN